MQGKEVRLHDDERLLGSTQNKDWCELTERLIAAERLQPLVRERIEIVKGKPFLRIVSSGKRSEPSRYVRNEYADPPFEEEA